MVTIFRAAHPVDVSPNGASNDYRQVGELILAAPCTPPSESSIAERHK